MICSGELCFRSESVAFETPPEKIKIETEGAVAVCVKRDAVADWRELLQALYYALYWRGPARDLNISALVFLAKTSQIREALSLSAAGRREAICAVLGTKNAVETAKMPRGEAYFPEGRWDPWAITKFALELVK